jgi:hypothetical protein
VLASVIVVAAAIYAVWALLPASTRHGLALRLAARLGGSAQPGWRGRTAARLERLANARKGGCADCPAHMATPAERAQRKSTQ